MSMDACGDDRLELIDKAKRRLLESTNIEDSPEEVAVLDSILFRFWQMGWLDHLRKDKGAVTCTMKHDGYYDEQCGIYRCSNCGEWWHFDCDGPREHGWKYCPKCQARIKEEAE